MTLKFEEEGHVYTFDGEVVPSVTQMLEPLYSYTGIPQHVLMAAADRGTAVHLACEYHDNGELGEVEESLQGYIDGWIQFIEDTKFEIELVENQIFHPLYRYAGTIDRVGNLAGRRVVLDIKTTKKLMPVAGPQLAAYLEAWNYSNPDFQADGRYVVQLKDDGTYVMHEHEDATDLQIFMSCISIMRWRKKHVG